MTSHVYDDETRGGLTSHVVDVELLPSLLLVQPGLDDLRCVWREEPSEKHTRVV